MSSRTVTPPVVPAAMTEVPPVGVLNVYETCGPNTTAVNADSACWVPAIASRGWLTTPATVVDGTAGAPTGASASAIAAEEAGAVAATL